MKASTSHSANDLWATHEKLVQWTCWRIIKRYGGDFDETFSEALVLYVEAVNSFEQSRGSLSNWISYKVFKGLQETKRVQARRLRITGPMENVPATISKQEGFLSGLLKNLSTESQDVLAILFDLDTDQFKNKSLAKLHLRCTLQRLGHSADRINACFSEIEAALV